MNCPARAGGAAGGFDERAFALRLLEYRPVLVAPCSSFNTPYGDHFRVITLPDADTRREVFDGIGSFKAAGS